MFPEEDDYYYSSSDDDDCGSRRVTERAMSEEEERIHRSRQYVQSLLPLIVSAVEQKKEIFQFSCFFGSCDPLVVQRELKGAAKNLGIEVTKIDYSETKIDIHNFYTNILCTMLRY